MFVAVFIVLGYFSIIGSKTYLEAFAINFEVTECILKPRINTSYLNVTVDKPRLFRLLQIQNRNAAQKRHWVYDFGITVAVFINQTVRLEI